MLPIRNLLTGFVAAWLMLGCVSDGQKGIETQGIPGAPAWVMSPEKAGHVSVIGSAPKQDWGGHAAQYRVAEMKARQELAQQVRVRVESINRYQTEDRSGTVSRSSDVETRLQSSVDLILEKARVIEEWTDPRSGELYIWLVTPL